MRARDRDETLEAGSRFGLDTSGDESTGRVANQMAIFVTSVDVVAFDKFPRASGHLFERARPHAQYKVKLDAALAHRSFDGREERSYFKIRDLYLVAARSAESAKVEGVNHTIILLGRP